MSQPWIKWVKGLIDRRETIIISNLINKDPHEVAGRLMKFWEWCDDNLSKEDILPDGSAVTVLSPLCHRNVTLLDDIFGLKGFTKAMEQVGWIIVKDDKITIPKFTKHNGITAKTRARNTLNQKNLRAKKKKEKKSKKEPREDVTVLSPQCHQNVTAPLISLSYSSSEIELENQKEEEKRTERGGLGEETKIDVLDQIWGFDLFWKEYPKKRDKLNTKRLWNSIVFNDHLLAKKIILAVREWAKTSEWLEDGGKYVPHPVNWIECHRWEDELPKPSNPNGKPSTNGHQKRQVFHSEELEMHGLKFIVTKFTDREIEIRDFDTKTLLMTLPPHPQAGLYDLGDYFEQLKAKRKELIHV